MDVQSLEALEAALQDSPPNNNPTNNEPATNNNNNDNNNNNSTTTSNTNNNNNNNNDDTSTTPPSPSTPSTTSTNTNTPTTPTKEKKEPNYITVPADYICPITRQLMHDPVTTEDGHTYEREALEEWLYVSGKTTSPVTALPLTDRTIYPNTFAKRMIGNFLDKYKERIDPDLIYIPLKSEGVKLREMVKGKRTKELLKIIEATPESVKTIVFKEDYALFHYICEFGTTSLLDDLMKILGNNNIAICETLNKPNEWSPSILTAKLIRSASEKNMANCTQFLALGGEPNRLYKDDKKSAFHFAVESFDRELIELFLLYGADPHTLDSDGYTPLHIPIHVPHEKSNEILNLLLDRGAKLDTKDKFGNTLVHRAAFHSNMECLLVLMERGMVDMTIQNNEKETPVSSVFRFTRAVDDKAAEMLRFIIGKGGNPSAEDDTLWQPLHWACKKKFFKSANVLVDAGANVNGKTSDGTAPIHWSAVGDPVMLKYLISKGANVNIQNNKGETPLHIAIDQNQPEIVRILLSNGADSTLKNSSDKAPDQLKYNSARDALIEALSVKKVREQMKEEIRSEVGELRAMIELQTQMIRGLQESLKAMTITTSTNNSNNVSNNMSNSMSNNNVSKSDVDNNSTIEIHSNSNNTNNSNSCSSPPTTEDRNNVVNES